MQHLGVAKERISLITNGVDTAHFKPLDLSARPATLTAIYVGRWAKGKGVEKILDVWEKGASLPGFNWNLQLVLPETPPKEMKERLRALEQRVSVTTGVSDPLGQYLKCDLALLLSEGEGLSNFVLEAMACGLPALVSQAAALPEAPGESTGTIILSQEEAGPDEILEELNKLASRPQDLQSLGKAARRYVEQHFSLDRIGRDYIALYKSKTK
jgi:glycosyltransferase involved in cell wall biosynthesis